MSNRTYEVNLSHGKGGSTVSVELDELHKLFDDGLIQIMPTTQPGNPKKAILKSLIDHISHGVDDDVYTDEMKRKIEAGGERGD